MKKIAHFLLTVLLCGLATSNRTLGMTSQTQRPIHRVNVCGDFNNLTEQISSKLNWPVDFATLAAEALYNIGLDPSAHYLIRIVGGYGCGHAGNHTLTSGQMVTGLMIEPDKLYKEYFMPQQPWGYGVCRFMLHHEAHHVFQYGKKIHINVLNAFEREKKLEHTAKVNHISKAAALALQTMSFEREADEAAAHTCNCWQCCCDWAHYLGMMSTIGGPLSDYTSAFPNGINSSHFLTLFGRSTSFNAAEQWIGESKNKNAVTAIKASLEEESNRCACKQEAMHPTNAERSVSAFISSVLLKKDNPNALCDYHRWCQTKEKSNMSSTMKQRSNTAKTTTSAHLPSKNVVHPCLTHRGPVPPRSFFPGVGFMYNCSKHIPDARVMTASRYLLQTFIEFIRVCFGKLGYGANS